MTHIYIHSKQTDLTPFYVGIGKGKRPYVIKHSEESKRKMSEANKGQVPWNKGVSCLEETKRKISKSKIGMTSPRKGIKLTKETRYKISEAAKLRKHSKEQIIKQSNSLKEYWRKKKLACSR